MTLTKRAKDKFLGKKTNQKSKRKNKKMRLNKQLFTKTFASFCLVLIFAPLSVVPTVSINTVNNAETAKSHLSISLKLDTRSQYALAADDNASQIVPGESTVDRENREKAEQEAKTRAEATAAAAAKAKAKASVTQASSVNYSESVNVDDIYARAQATYGVDARVLKAIHIVETGASSSTSRTSSAGAVGPMQFLPSTWRSHGVDGNGDGVADITNVTDAIFTAAAYLKACGYPDVQKALWGYNPSTSYYNKVMSVAHSLGY